MTTCVGHGSSRRVRECARSAREREGRGSTPVKGEAESRAEPETRGGFKKGKKGEGKGGGREASDPTPRHIPPHSDPHCRNRHSPASLDSTVLLFIAGSSIGAALEKLRVRNLIASVLRAM